MKLQINLFCQKQNRFKLTSKMVSELIASDKKDFRILIYGQTHNINMWKEYLNKTDVREKDIQLITVNSHEYMEKIGIAHMSDAEYSCKLDDDILFSTNTFDFIYENLNKLDVNKFPIISPSLTNGMISTELFVKDFLTSEEREEIYKKFLSGTVAPNIWGLDFSGINDKIKTMNRWDDLEYWNFVDSYDNKYSTRGCPWFYWIVKGVHPIRFSYEINKYLANIVVSRKEKIFEKQDYKLEYYSTPYFTNNVFFCRTEYWKKTIGLFHDGWDEGQLTLQMKKDGTSPLYVRNGFGIHMAYGCTENQEEIENLYMNGL